MEMSGSYRIAAPRQAVWDALNDPEVLRANIPGCEELNKTGENGTDNTVFDTNMEVAVNKGAGGATGMNIAKLREAKKLLMENEVDIDMDTLWCLLTAKQHDDLLSETQAISLDYNTKPVLVDGKISQFMGFNFIHTERLGLYSKLMRERNCC